MKAILKICLAAILLFPSIVFSQSINEVLKKWVEINSNQIGRFSLRATGENNHYSDSLFKDKNGDYRWNMRLDYAKPKGQVAHRIMNGYFNCDKSEVSFDQQIDYTKNGIVVNVIGEQGGQRHIIPVTPDSVAELSLNFVCKTKFD